MGKRQGRSRWTIGLLMFLGLFAGNVIGQALEPLAPILGTGARLSAGPGSLNILDLLELTAGFSMHLNLTGAIGGILATIAGSRL